MALGIADPLAPLWRYPATAGTFSDFDGPLSPIVEDPDLAEPVAAVPRSAGTPAAWAWEQVGTSPPRLMTGVNALEEADGRM